MFLRRIIVQNFKNIGSADISFSPKINCICGNNGEGKTNLLDAVHYLSMTKSFLSVNDRYTYTYGKDEAVLHGTFQDGDREEDIAVSVRSDGAKTVRRNGKAYKRLSEHIGRIPVVMTAPPDISLIHDSGEERRRFLNMMISQIDPEYLRSVSAYEDQGVYTFVPVEVSPVQEENNASGRMRRNHPVKTVYVVSYQASDGSGYEYDYEAGSVDTIAQKIVEEGEPIERRVFSVPDEGTYITVEADETAETYVAGQRKRFVLISIVSVLYLVIWGMVELVYARR